MAFTEPTSGGRVIKQGILPCRVTLARACKCGDILGVAEDNFDDLGPSDSHVNGHATGVTYVHRLVAGEDGEAAEVITAYPAAVVGGYTGGALGTKLYCAENGTDGAISETVGGDTGDNATIIGLGLSANDALLYPGFVVDVIA